MVGLVVNTVMDLLSNKLLDVFHKDMVYLAFALNYILLFVIITTLFTLIFKTLPDGKVSLRDCIIGSSFTALLFILGKFAIGFYLGSAAIVSVYGAAGSILLILIWVYYSAIILFFGAEFTKVYAITHGKNIIPNEYTVLIHKEIVTAE
jgi:membrane protein